MRPITVRLAAAGYSPWIPLNRGHADFPASLAVNLSSGAVLTYSVQYTLDDFQAPENLTQRFTLSRTTTVLTVAKVAHGLLVGDYANLWGNGGAPLDAEFPAIATVPTADSFTLTVANSGRTSGNGTGWLQTARVFNHAQLNSLGASASGNFIAPVSACRLFLSAYTSGTADLTVLQGGG